MSSSRIIDCSVHYQTAPQIMERMLRFFRESRQEPIVILTVPGEGESTIHKLRNELSRARRTFKQAGRSSVHFGFTCSEELYIHVDGELKTAFALSYHMTQLQQMKNFANKVDFEEATI